MRGDERLRREASAWLARLLAPDGDAARDAFEAWRAADPRRREAYARVEQSWRRSILLKHSPLTWNPVISGPARPRRRWRPIAAGLSAALAVASVAFVIVSREDPPSSYATAVGEIRTVTLPDGSRVTLDTRSRIAFDFSGIERRVRLEQGRARFDVVHDVRRPFVVNAGPAQITDRGTVFDIDHRGRSVDIVLLEGSIEVRPLRSSGGADGRRAAVATLVPGQRLRLDAGTARLTPAPTRYPARSWTSGMLAFDDRPLGDIVAEANRYSTTPIILGDPRLRELRITGAFRAGSAAAVAQKLAAPFGLRIASGEKGALVLMPPATPTSQK